MNSRDDAERLYLENEKLIYGALYQYFPALAFDEDIQQIARIGLWKACLNYDADKSCFSTAAYKFIKTEVLQELRKKATPRQNHNNTFHCIGVRFDRRGQRRAGYPCH